MDNDSTQEKSANELRMRYVSHITKVELIFILEI